MYLSSLDIYSAGVVLLSWNITTVGRIRIKAVLNPRLSYRRLITVWFDALSAVVYPNNEMCFRFKDDSSIPIRLYFGTFFFWPTLLCRIFFNNLPELFWLLSSPPERRRWQKSQIIFLPPDLFPFLICQRVAAAAFRPSSCLAKPSARGNAAFLDKKLNVARGSLFFNQHFCRRSFTSRALLHIPSNHQLLALSPGDGPRRASIFIIHKIYWSSSVNRSHMA